MLIEFLPLLLREFMANKSINPTGTHSTKPLENWGVVEGTNKPITGQYPGRGRGGERGPITGQYPGRGRGRGRGRLAQRRSSRRPVRRG